MITLDKTTRSLEVILGGSVATNELPVTVVYYDVLAQTKGDYSEYQRATSLNTTAGATAVTICEAPTRNGVTRNIVYICVENADTGANVVTIRINDNGTFYTQYSQSLASSKTLAYEHGAGWQVL